MDWFPTTGYQDQQDQLELEGAKAGGVGQGTGIGDAIAHPWPPADAHAHSKGPNSTPPLLPTTCRRLGHVGRPINVSEGPRGVEQDHTALQCGSR
jgi:hypothetical protein